MHSITNSERRLPTKSKLSIDRGAQIGTPWQWKNRRKTIPSTSTTWKWQSVCERVITNLGVYGFDPESREMVLEKLHPGVSVDEVRSEVGWPLKIKEPLSITARPGKDVLELLRNELDPQGIYLGPHG